MVNYPFYGQYQYQNPYMGYQQQIPNQYQSNSQQLPPTQMSVANQIQQNNQQTIPGQMVDSLDAARAKDIDMSGAPRYYPNINGQEIYMKQLQADGTCPTVVYKRVVTEVAPVNTQTADMYAEAFNKVFNELDAIKAMISEPKTRGGAKA